jgi:hypothetical protein
VTDNFIVDAIEWCEEFENNLVFVGNGDEKCVQALQMMVVIKHALKDYTSQKAEIEMLQFECGRLERHTKMHDEIITEAIKEFAEMVKGQAHIVLRAYCNMDAISEFENCVDNLVKEMVGEDK